MSFDAIDRNSGLGLVGADEVLRRIAGEVIIPYIRDDQQLSSTFTTNEVRLYIWARSVWQTRQIFFLMK